MWYWLVFGGLAVVGEIFTIRWHTHRESGSAWRAASISAILEGLTYAPVWFVIQNDDIGILISSVVGSAIGTFVGMKKAT